MNLDHTKAVAERDLANKVAVELANINSFHRLPLDHAERAKHMLGHLELGYHDHGKTVSWTYEVPSVVGLSAHTDLNPFAHPDQVVREFEIVVGRLVADIVANTKAG
jgi:hypothetical protein